MHFWTNRSGISWNNNAITKWPTPNTIKDVQQFLGFCNFYQNFIQDFAKITRPIWNLTQNSYKWRKSFHNHQRQTHLAICLVHANWYWSLQNWMWHQQLYHWSCTIPKTEQKMVTNHIYYHWMKLQDPRQEITSDHQDIRGMATLPSRKYKQNWGHHRSQKPWILPNCKETQLKKSPTPSLDDLMILLEQKMITQMSPLFLQNTSDL